VLVEMELGGEDRERSLEETRRAIRMVAGAPTHDLAGPPGEVVEVARRRAARGDATSRLGDRAETKDARAALAGAFAGHVVQDSRGRPDTAALDRQEPDQSAAEAQPAVRQENRIEDRSRRSSTAAQPPK